MTPDRWPEIDRLFHAALERSAGRTRGLPLDRLRRRRRPACARSSPCSCTTAAAAPFLEQPALHLEAGRLASDAAVGYEPEIQGFTIVRDARRRRHGRRVPR